MAERVILRRLIGFRSTKGGAWAPSTTADGRRSAKVWCGGCGGFGFLDGHDIADDGTVSPSLVCPHGCGWHVWAQLELWPPGSETPDDLDAEALGS